jgi:hypothetical protein
MKKVFISQRMRGLSHDNIVLIRENIQKSFKETFGPSFEFIESYKPELKHKSPIDALGASLQMMSDADIILIPEDIKNTDFKNLKGVEFEYLIAKSYGKHVLLYLVREDLSVLITGALFAVK